MGPRNRLEAFFLTPLGFFWLPAPCWGSDCFCFPAEGMGKDLNASCGCVKFIWGTEIPSSPVYSLFSLQKNVSDRGGIHTLLSTNQCFSHWQGNVPWPCSLNACLGVLGRDEGPLCVASASRCAPPASRSAWISGILQSPLCHFINIIQHDTHKQNHPNPSLACLCFVMKEVSWISEWWRSIDPGLFAVLSSEEFSYKQLFLIYPKLPSAIFGKYVTLVQRPGPASAYFGMMAFCWPS